MMARCGCGAGGCSCRILKSNTNCVETFVTGTGASDDPYYVSSEPKLDPTAGNLLSCEATGLRADLERGNTPSISLSGAGTPTSPLLATATPPPLAHSDTASVILSGAGTLVSPLTADVVPVVAEDFIAASRDEDELTVGVGTSVLMFPFDIEILGVSAAVTTAPTGADIILDLNMAAVTIFTDQADRPTILASAADTAGEAVPAIVTIPAYSHITMDRDQVGSTIAGGPLSLFIRYRRA